MKREEGLCLIEIYGDGCASCHAMIGEVNAVAQELNLPVRRISAEAYPDAVQKYAIERIPSVVLADGDKVIAKCSGFQPREILLLWAEAKIEENKDKR